MTIVVTVNVEARYRGFLASTMLEIAPGVYTSPRMTSGIREPDMGSAQRLVPPAVAGGDSDDLARPGSPRAAAHQDTGRGAKDHSRCRRSALGKVQLAALPGSN